MPSTAKTPTLYLLTRHWLSLIGAGLVTTAGISWLFVLPMEIRGHASNPYVGIIVFLILPIVFFTGLALIPIGVFLSKRKIREGLSDPTVDRVAARRRLLWFLGITSFLNIVIGTQVTYRAVEQMETPQFCGGTCHAMSPEFAAYVNAPHSSVECVECHVAPGVSGWVASKANGTRQLIETVMGTAHKPIPSAIASNRLVPASETCENCHWPQKSIGMRLRILSKYAEDETNSRSETVLLMRIGGNGGSGIHGAHLGPGVHIRFVAADPDRQTIPWVEYRNSTTGEIRAFSSGDPPRESVSKIEMQCVDCHNRPAHAFDLPERAVDNALARSDIPSTLPFIRKKGVELLKKDWQTRQAAAEGLGTALEGYYRESYPDIATHRAGELAQAKQALLAIYDRNVFPDLKVTWGTYPNNLGHTDFPGCFRCHDGSHSTSDGKTITQDCGACHQALAMDEPSPAIWKTLGLSDQISHIHNQ